MHNQNFVIISGAEAHPVTGRLNALDTAEVLSGRRDSSYALNLFDKTDAGRFLESPTPIKMTIYGPVRTVTIYPVAASN